jgi:hypothetical protein
MKNLYKLSKIGFLSTILLLSSCETLDTELTDNPNFLTPDQASADFFLNSIQEDFARWVYEMGKYGLDLTRIEQMSGDRTYDNWTSPTSFSGSWQSAYQGMLLDIRLMQNLASEAGLSYYIGMGQVFESYIMMTLVDYFGDVPYTEALLGSDNLNPGLDSGASIYNAALALLDSAISNFNAGGSGPEYDMYYGGDASKWIKAANSIKKRAYLNLGDYGSYSSITNYISSNADDFQFQWGDNDSNPDTRNPLYVDTYTAGGAGEYMSNDQMNRMMIGRNGMRDPRINYLYYRQNSFTPGAGGADPNQIDLNCSVDGFYQPPHIVAYGVYCNLPEGYWGRDHGDDSGIPPDGLLRTTRGIYPAGGLYDDGSFQAALQGTGLNGAGITPIILASWMHFMDAEVAASGGNGDVTASTLSGIESFFNKVDDISGAPAMEQSTIDAYIANFAAEWGAASSLDAKLELWAEEFWVTQAGNGIDAYNSYRRNGYPKNLQPTLEPDPGSFPLSFWYPQNFAAGNSNVSQKSSQSERVFWNANGPTVD